MSRISKGSFLIWMAVAFAVFVADGCASHGGARSSKKKHDPPIKLPPSVSAQDVTFIEYGGVPNRVKYYEVRTPSVRGDISQSGGAGHLQQAFAGKVSGTVFDKLGAPTATFSADSGAAESSGQEGKSLDLLLLHGNVHVHGLKPPDDLFCDYVRFEMKTRIVKAFDQVRVHSPSGVTGTLRQVWATQDLKRFSSPPLFNASMNQPQEARFGTTESKELAPHPVHFEMPASGYTLDASNGSLLSEVKETRFLLVNKAKAVSREMNFATESMWGQIFQPTGKSKPYLHLAQTSAETTVTRTVALGQSSTKTTISGSSSSFVGDSAVARIAIAGPVVITDSRPGRSELKLTGRTARVELDMRAKPTNDALKSAEVDGSVTLHLIQASDPKNPFDISGDSLSLDHFNGEFRIVLSNHVIVQKAGKFGGMGFGLSRASLIVGPGGTVRSYELGGAKR